MGLHKEEVPDKVSSGERRPTGFKARREDLRHNSRCTSLHFELMKLETPRRSMTDNIVRKGGNPYLGMRG